MQQMSNTKEPTQGRETGINPRARMLLLLGDQLIRDKKTAAFELVKECL
jgi:hypothetical protein